MKRDFSCKISLSGKLPGQVSREIADVIRGMPGANIKITITLQEKPRSLAQNKFYQGPFIQTVQKYLLNFGRRLHHDDIHDGLKKAYAKNGYSIPLPDGTYFDIPPSTRRLEKQDFERYLEEIRADYAQRFEWQLPLPNEVPIDAYE